MNWGGIAAAYERAFKPAGKFRCSLGEINGHFKGRRPNGGMTFGSSPFAMILMLLAVVMLEGCASSGIPQDGRYQTHGGGWDNWRG